MTTKSRSRTTPNTPEPVENRMNGGHPPVPVPTPDASPSPSPNPVLTPTEPERPATPPVLPNTEPGTNGQEAAFNWGEATKADAVRQASKLLNGEKSPAKVLKWLKDQHGITVESPQVSGVLKKMYAVEAPPVLDQGSVKLGVKAIRAVDKFAATVGGLEALEEQIEQCTALVQFANTLGGLEMLRSIISEMRDDDAAE